MAKYTTKRTYTKKSTGPKKAITKEVTKPVKLAPVVKETVWQKVKGWLQGIVG